MKKLYEKSELAFTIAWIVVYCALQSFANPLNERIGIAYSASAVFCILQAAVLFSFIRRNSLMKRYGLCKSSVAARRFLFYVPLIILATGNLWNGAVINDSLSGIACRMICMLCVGFLEEVIFRGFLFKAVAKDNVKFAIIISSVTFGIGHLVNLCNGSGMNLADNLYQICFAVAVGFLFVTIFYRSGSLLPCIITHSAINMSNAFANEAGITWEGQMMHGFVMIVITALYAFILAKTLPETLPETQKENRSGV